MSGNNISNVYNLRPVPVSRELSVEKLEMIDAKMEVFKKLLAEYKALPYIRGRMLVYADTAYDPIKMPITIVLGVFCLVTEFGPKIGYSPFSRGIRGGGIYADSEEEIFDLVRNRLKDFYAPGPLADMAIDKSKYRPRSEYGFSLIHWTL